VDTGSVVAWHYCLLMNGEHPAHVPDTVLDELRSREGRNGLITLPPPLSPAPRFRPGDRVRIKSGALVGFKGLVEGLRPHERVAVLLQLLGRVELTAADVEPARE
jgi:transcription antitermination factor NusG